MDHATFDRLIRHLGTTSTRRTGLGLVLGTAGGVLAGLFVTDEPGADGKGKNRNKNKRKKKKRTKQACPDTSTDCGGGVCAGAGECCPGEKPCGGGCIRARECCPYTERPCPSGVCVSKDACCPITEERCGAECCGLGSECCNGACELSDGGVCTADGWCPPLIGWACGVGSNSAGFDGPCCDIAAGEGCCVTQLEPFIETTCCPGGAEQCAPGGCCPAGTGWKGDCEACCTHGTTNCSSCRAPVGGRG
jgi:hypothetical protein